jgi:ribosome biogenesis GTPase
MDGIERLGFDPDLLDRIDPAETAGRRIARVAAVHRERYVLVDGKTEAFAELEGKLRYGADSPVDLPAVGDWVVAAFYDDDSHAIIHRVLPRKSLLKRKTPGKKIDFQIIAANIDTAFIVQSLDANFNLPRLERYLVMVHEAGIVPVVLLSKSDLLPASEIEDRVVRVMTRIPRLRVQPFSNRTEFGMAEIQGLLVPKKTYCLLGSSGVGKTTLIHRLVGEERFMTRPVREKDGKGRHATSVRQLIRITGGAMIVDTPGMRELGNLEVETGIAETFDELPALAANCRFADCTHEHEAGCAVLQALQDGRLAEERYRNFIKLSRESRFNRMSYLEKRRRDKRFGKMVKRVMKDKTNRR